MTRKCLSAEQRMNQLMILNVRRKILRSVCIEGIICYGGMHEINSNVNR